MLTLFHYCKSLKLGKGDTLTGIFDLQLSISELRFFFQYFKKINKLSIINKKEWILLYFFLFIEVILGIFAFYFFYLVPKSHPYNQGLKFLDVGNFDEAILEFNRAVEKEPSNYEAHFKLANLYLKKEVFIKAEEHLQKILDIQKFNEEIQKSDILHKLGEVEFTLKNYEKAYLAFREIITYNSSDYEANFHLGLIYAGQFLYQDAIKYFRKAIQSQSNDINARINAALCLVEIDNISDAVVLFDEAIGLAPDNLKIKFFLGITFFMSQGYKRAVNLFMDTLKKTDDNEQKSICYRLLSISYYFLKSIPMTTEILDTSIEFYKLNNLIDQYKQALFDYILIFISDNQLELAKEKLGLLKILDNSYGFTDQLVQYLDFKTKPKEKQEEVEDSQHSPLIYSYFKAAQHIIGLDEEKAKDANAEQMDEMFEEIKKAWMDSFISENFLWKLGGLTASRIFNLEVLSQKEKLDDIKSETQKFTSGSFVKEFMKLDRKAFMEISRKIVIKLGYKIVNENAKPDLADFVAGDGIDFTVQQIGNPGVTTLVQIRRWEQGKVGEITFHNLLHHMSEAKTRKGIFIVPAEVTPDAQKFIEKIPQIRVISLNDLSQLLRSVMNTA